jgi:hypothetical protein
LLDAVRWLVGATDWSTAGILALIVLLDGLRRAPADAVLVRKFGAGAWGVVPRGTRRPRLTLASWGAPFVTTLLLPAGGSGLPDPEWRARYDGLRRWLPVMRVLAAASLVLVVAGIPIAIAAAGGMGFLATIAALLALSLTTAVLGYVLVRRLADQPGALAWAAHLASPFSTPRAAELLLERHCAGRSQPALLHLLLPPPAFHAWIRARAFDRMQPGAAPDPELDAVLDREALRQIIARFPAELSGDEAFCPRCGGIYREAPEACPDCEVGLTVAAG